VRCALCSSAPRYVQVPRCRRTGAEESVAVSSHSASDHQRPSTTSDQRPANSQQGVRCVPFPPPAASTIDHGAPAGPSAPWFEHLASAGTSLRASVCYLNTFTYSRGEVIQPVFSAHSA
jgi:hypothetical protein